MIYKLYLELPKEMNNWSFTQSFILNTSATIYFPKEAYKWKILGVP